MKLPIYAKSLMQRVDLLSRLNEARQLVCSFFWSDEFGLFCSVPEWLLELEDTGLAISAGMVYPSEGRRFFDALQVLTSSLVEITVPRLVLASEVYRIR